MTQHNRETLLALAGDAETVARALWFDWCDQQGWPNGQPTWDEMAGENAGDRGPRYAEFMSLAAAALATLQPVEPKVSSDVDADVLRKVKVAILAELLRADPEAYARELTDADVEVIARRAIATLRASDPSRELVEALQAVEAAMLNGGDGGVGDYGWSITKLNKARPLIRTALAQGQSR